MRRLLLIDALALEGEPTTGPDRIALDWYGDPTRIETRYSRFYYSHEFTDVDPDLTALLWRLNRPVWWKRLLRYLTGVDLSGGSLGGRSKGGADA